MNSITTDLIITGIVTFLGLSLISFLIIGFFIGRITIYRKTIVDRQNVELRYKIYTKKWLNNLTVDIEQLTSSRDSIPLRLHILWPNKEKTAQKWIIFHHGITASHVVGFKHAKYYLEKGYAFVCYDSRGWGDNSYNGYCTYGIFEKDDLYDVVKYIYKTKDVDQLILHGESMGGKTVLEYGVNYDNLNLVNGYVVDSGFVDFLKVFIFNLKKITPLMPYWLIYLPATFYIYQKTTKTIGKNDISGSLYKIKNPVLAIHSPIDNSCPFNQFKTLSEKISNLEYLITSNSPHCLTSVFHRKLYIKKIDTLIKNVEKESTKGV